jgi:hypothetical protein
MHSHRHRRDSAEARKDARNSPEFKQCRISPKKTEDDKDRSGQKRTSGPGKV